MKFHIKFCGITSPKDAAMVVKEGATAVGLNFWRGSKRFVEDSTAREIMAEVPKGVLRIGVFVNAHPLVVTETLAELGLDMVQLHGDEKAGSWTEIASKRIARAIRVFDEASMKESLIWEPGLFIYDAHTETYGGSGVTAPWDLIARQARRPFLLAGGLTPENVAEAIATVRPDGVDVASGVETTPGQKDLEKVRRFVAAAHEAARAAGLEI